MVVSHQRAPAEAGGNDGAAGPSDGDRRTSPSSRDDESASPPTMHTPMLTHYVHLPDRELSFVRFFSCLVEFCKVLFLLGCLGIEIVGAYSHIHLLTSSFMPQSTSEIWTPSYLPLAVGRRARQDHFPVALEEEGGHQRMMVTAMVTLDAHEAIMNTSGFMAIVIRDIDWQRSS